MGRGVKGSLTWTVNETIVAALEKAFYLAFDNVEPTNKNILIGVDVSASMTWYGIGGIEGFTPAMASAVMAMVIARKEPNHHIVGFSGDIVDLGITANMDLQTVIDKIYAVRPGRTNIPAVLDYAISNRLDVDAFVVLTDNETYMAGHVCEKFVRYGKGKFITCAMESNGFTVADPNNANMLDIVGFDTATPNMINEFIK